MKVRKSTLCPLGVALLALGCHNPASVSGPVLTIVHPDGAPASGVGVVVARADEVMDSGFTDKRGAIRMPPGAAGAEVFVQGASYYGVRLPVPVADATYVLPPGDMLCGQVLVEGRAPARPIGVWFRPEHPGRYEWNDTVYDHMDRLGLDGQRTDDEGRFQFSGIPEGWEGRLILPFHLDYDRNLTWKVRAGGPVLVIPAVPMACLVGRCVLEGDGSPLAGVGFTWTIEIRDDLDDSPGWAEWVHDWTKTRHGRTDHEGVFHAPLWYPILVSGPGSDRLELPDVLHDLALGRARRLVLEFLTHDGRYSARVERSDVDLSDGLDLGVIELTPSPTWTLVVVDPSDQPIEGAVVATGPDGTRESERTRADGLAILHGPRPEKVWVRAPRHQARVLELAEDLAFPLECTLPEAACLTIRIEGNGDLLGVEIGVRGDGFFRDEDATLWPSNLIRAGDVRSTSYRSDGTTRWIVAEDGKVALTDLAPGLPFEVDLVDHLGRRTGVRDTVTLGVAEVRQVVLKAPALVSLSGIMVDAQGLPIAGAIVDTESPLSRRTRTADDGRFAFHGVTDQPVALRIEVGDVRVREAVVAQPGPGETRVVVTVGG